MSTSRTPLIVVLLAVVALVAACAAPPRQDTGSIELVASTHDALSASDVAKVTLTVTGPGIATPFVHDLSQLGVRWTGVVGGIPTGIERTLHADAYDAGGAIIFRGDVLHVAIQTDATAAIAVLLQQANPPVPFQNGVPVIDSFVASSKAIAPGHTVALATAAHDPDTGDALTFAWTSTGGTFTSTSALTTTWNAPTTSGPQTLTIKASDAKGAIAAMSVTVSVDDSNGQGAVNVGADFNTWPTVASIVPSPTRIDVGETTTITTAASDVDGDPLTYAWSASCAGTFNSTTAASPTFTLAAPLASTSCTLTVVANDDRGGQGTGTLVIQTGPGAAVVLPPQVDQTFQSALVANGGDTFTFRVRAHDPQGGALTFAWTANAGTLGAHTDAPTTSQTTWTAPLACQSGVKVTATITNALGLSTAQPFDVAFDTTSDPNNCGACGTTCGGAACSGSVCQVVTAWKVVPGAVTDVQAGGDGSVWGRNGTSAVRWDGTAFVAVTSPALAQIAVGASGTVWGLGTDRAAVHYEGSQFVTKGGPLTQLAVGASDANVWGVYNVQGETQIIRTWDGAAFTQITGNLASIAAGGGEVWGINNLDSVFRLNPTSLQFEPRSGVLHTVVVTGTGVAWGLNPQGAAFYWTGTAFESGNTTAHQLAPGADGSMWALGDAGATSAWNGAAFESRGKAPIGTITAVSVGTASSVWAVDATAQKGFHWQTCVAAGAWSSTPSVCCSAQWTATNKCL